MSEELQRELLLEEQKGLWFWDIPRQPLTLQDWAVMMRPTLAIYNNAWARELLLHKKGMI